MARAADRGNRRNIIAPGKSKVLRPKRELKGFARVELAPGESRTVTVPLDARSFAY